MIKGGIYQNYSLATTGSIFKFKKILKLDYYCYYHDIVIYNKEYALGLHPSSWYRTPKILGIPKY